MEKLYIMYDHFIKYEKSHRDEGPAFIAYDDYGHVFIEKYYKNGMLHREGSPAYIAYDDYGYVIAERYYKNGVLHREDGFAIKRYYHGNIISRAYYINGKEVDNV